MKCHAKYSVFSAFKIFHILRQNVNFKIEKVPL